MLSYKEYLILSLYQLKNVEKVLNYQLNQEVVIELGKKNQDFFKVLRVLLAKDPDISLPTFGAPSMFGCIIKSIYDAYVPEPKS